MSTEADPNRRPHPVEILASVDPPDLPGDASAESAATSQGRVLLQDSRPIAQSLEWELSREYWRERGVTPFIEAAVPYVVHNSGEAARAAAKVLLAACESLATRGSPIRILELGAGIGLFARHLLDDFQELCRDQQLPHYEHLQFFVSDGSEQTVRGWQRAGVFDDHSDRVVLAVCDATKPQQLLSLDGNRIELPPLAAIFANYVLDSLPMAVVKQGAGGPEQLHVSSYVHAEDQLYVERDTGLAWDDLLDRVTTGAISSELLELVPYLRYEVSFRPDGAAELPWVREILAPDDDSAPRHNLNYGALACVESCWDLLTPTGFVLISDYGAIQADHTADLAYVSRFGGSLAAGLDFPFLSAFCEGRGVTCVVPEAVPEQTIHARLLGRSLPENVCEQFRTVFSDRRRFEADDDARQAADAVQAGRLAEALDAYRRAVEKCPEDWNLLGLAAQFLTQQLLRPQEAQELVELALARNPWFSSFLWNTLGNCWFYQEEHDRAHQAYLRAREIHPRDPQAHLNLAYTFGAQALWEEALHSVARGLLHDVGGRFESALLQKQKQLLVALDLENAARDERDKERHSAFSTAR